MHSWLRLGLLAAAVTFPSEFTGKVAWVSDGDTIRVNQGHTTTTIRFQAVDAPEIAHKAYGDRPATDAQPFGYDAKDFTFRKASRQVVRVAVDEIDKYGRSVGTIFLPDGTNLNEALVAAGYGWWYAKYAPTRSRLARLEAEARHRKLGLWRDPDPMPPWIFRHPELREEWEKSKCELRTDGCPAEKETVTCAAEASVKDVGGAQKKVRFDADGSGECVARALLDYQLCRAEGISAAPVVACGAK
jgi:endonuclease YncB( thermonuclease family)